MTRVYKTLVEAESELPFFQLVAFVIHDEHELEPARLESRLRSWLAARGERLVAIDDDETSLVAEEYVPQSLREGTSETEAISGRIFFPRESSLWQRLERWFRG